MTKWLVLLLPVLWSCEPARDQGALSADVGRALSSELREVVVRDLEAENAKRRAAAVAYCRLYGFADPSGTPQAGDAEPTVAEVTQWLLKLDPGSRERLLLEYPAYRHFARQSDDRLCSALEADLQGRFIFQIRRALSFLEASKAAPAVPTTASAAGRRSFAQWQADGQIVHARLMALPRETRRDLTLAYHTVLVYGNTRPVHWPPSRLELDLMSGLPDARVRAVGFMYHQFPPLGLPLSRDTLRCDPQIIVMFQPWHQEGARLFWWLQTRSPGERSRAIIDYERLTAAECRMLSPYDGFYFPALEHSLSRSGQLPRRLPSGPSYVANASALYRWFHGQPLPKRQELNAAYLESLETYSGMFMPTVLHGCLWVEGDEDARYAYSGYVSWTAQERSGGNAAGTAARVYRWNGRPLGAGAQGFRELLTELETLPEFAIVHLSADPGASAPPSADRCEDPPFR